MKAIDFPESTKNMMAPPGFTKEEVFDLPVNEGFYFIRGFHPVACLTSCWQITDEEWMEWKPKLNFSKDDWMALKPENPNVYLNIMGFGMPPVSLDVKNPCGDAEFKHVGKYFHEHGVLPKDYLEEIKELENKIQKAFDD